MCNSVKDPTPKEIAQRAAAIRATWDEKTHEERRVWKGRVEWELPWIGRECVDGFALLQFDTAESALHENA